jgi:phenylacetate-CoA ligase
MNRLLDPLMGRLLSAAGDVALSSWATYRSLFAPILTGPVREQLSRRRAAAAFFNARRTVPAYREFLAGHGLMDVRHFEDVPPMDKDSYIKKWPLESLCQNGRIPDHGVVIDESSGSSGTATNWIRGPAERAIARRLIQYSARATFGNDTFVLLNAFALGPWATGMNVSMSMVDRCILKSIGPDAGKVAATLELLGPRYRYLIAGYPPFLKSLVETASIDWKDFNICAIVGGEGMSEALRSVLNNHFRKTISSFGASDLEINIAVETDYTIALRQRLSVDPALSVALCGSERMPMIFQYDPLNYLVESDSERNLLVTINRLETVSPRVRYNIRDRGIVRSTQAVDDVLETQGRPSHARAPRLDLPLLFHWGRQDSSVAFYGCKITPEDVQHVVLRVAALGQTIANFALHPWEDEGANKRLELWLELAPGAPTPDNAAAIDDAVWRELAAVNQDFRESIKMVPPNRRPTVKLFTFGESPISGQDVRIKKQYIVY